MDHGNVKDDLLPGGDGLRKAMRWISDQLQDTPQRSRLSLVDEASRRFDLTPAEADFLLQRPQKEEP